MDPSIEWTERWRRTGWRSSYTRLGGKARDSSAWSSIALLDQHVQNTIERLTSHAFVAVSESHREVSPDVRFFTTVAKKVLQRGSHPVVDLELEPGQWSDSVVADFIAAAIGPTTSTTKIDPAIRLDPTFEQQLWNAVAPLPIARFLTPQAPFEAMIAMSRQNSERWVDFLLNAPWLDAPVVIELDGSGHTGGETVDADRDKALAEGGYKIARHPGQEAWSAESSLLTYLREVAAQAPPAPNSDLVLALHGPPAFTRLALAIVELLETGQLPTAGSWALAIRDDLGVAPSLLPAALDLLSGIAAVWSLHVMPQEVSYGGGTLIEGPDGYISGQPSSAVPEAATIYLQPFVPPHAELPTRASHDHVVVVRGAHLPIEPSWLAGPSSERRGVRLDDKAVDGGLARVCRSVFGFQKFREGQAEAIKASLAGHDAAILLPTGAGKSLIYQLAGLLRPGVTLVVDPLVSLIDDQERRFRVEGMDRVSALHSARVSNADDREEAFRLVAKGDALFVFLTPERLQSQAFRDSLAQTAEQQSVNSVIVDEAHCVSEWGHDFRTAYLRLGRNLRKLCAGLDDVVPPMLALTGTASPAVLRDVLRELEDHERPMDIQRPANFDRPNLRFHIMLGEAATLSTRLKDAVRADIPGLLAFHPADLRRLSGGNTKSGIVFVPHVNGTYGLTRVRAQVRDALDEATLDEGEPATAIGIYSGSAPEVFSGGRQAWDRAKAEAAEMFKSNETAVLVSTKAFGMGIDKPNIRWTMHVGYPSSIEAFAQEAGRAGRDGLDSLCVLIASPPDPDLAGSLLNLGLAHNERQQLFKSQRDDDDLNRQLFFLHNNFEGVDIELEHSLAMLEALHPLTPGRTVQVSRESSDARAREQEKALYRLSMVGLVDDYTIDYGAKRFTVYLDEFNAQTVDEAMIRFVQRVEPGRLALRRDAIASAPADIDDRLRHHLELMLRILYDVIEPARVRALAEMNQLALLGDDQEAVRDRIRAYLSDGPMSGILLDIAESTSVDVSAVIRELDTVPAEDPREWVGISARQLEAYPGHPVLLLVRGMGEALLRDGDSAIVERSLKAAIVNLSSYGVGVRGAARLVTWAAEQLRNQQSGRGWDRVVDFYEAWDESGLPSDGLAELEEVVLANAEAGHFHSAELAAVLTRRIRRGGVEATTFTRDRTARIGVAK